MSKRSRNGHVLHAKRPVSPGRLMHVTAHTKKGVPSLRRPELLALFRDLVTAARGHGLKTAVFVLMDDHIHWSVVPDSRQAVGDGLRYVLGRFAKGVNRLFGRKGKVFVERAWWSCARTARHAWQVLGYILRNPTTAERRPARGLLDNYTGVVHDTLDGSAFLRGMFGSGADEAQARERWWLLLRMSNQVVAYRAFADRLQLALPGL